MKISVTYKAYVYSECLYILYVLHSRSLVVTVSTLFSTFERKVLK